MFRSGRELWAAFLAAIIITGVYGAVVVFTRQIPPAKDFFGLGLGILGFILMLMTEVLYSLRKRSRLAHWGRMSDWMEFHVFTGLVGPYMVLLHTSWKFNGLAGGHYALYDRYCDQWFYRSLHLYPHTSHLRRDRDRKRPL